MFADCKILISLILFKYGLSILGWTALSWIFFFGGGGFKIFLDGSVDHIIYRDYIAKRRSFIYCSLACGPDVAAILWPFRAKNYL